MKQVKVWDIGIRLFHWALVLLFATSLYSAFQDKFGIYADMHIYSGFAVIVLVLWRIIWGVVGSETARFSSFIKSPSSIKSYLKTGKVGVGHNPLGGLSVILMLALFLVQAVLGLFSSDGILFEGPLSGYAADSSTITNIHETLGFVLMWLVGLHVSAVFFYRVVKKQKLIKPMITGLADACVNEQAPKMRSTSLALIILLLVFAAVYYAVPW